jgi:hypothetical protein
MSDLIAAEFLKMRTTRTFWWVAGLALALSLLVTIMKPKGPHQSFWQPGIVSQSLETVENLRSLPDQGLPKTKHFNDLIALRRPSPNRWKLAPQQ